MTRMNISRRGFAGLAAGLAGAAVADPVAAKDGWLARFALYAEQERRRHELPGMSVAVVEGQDTLMLAGFGEKTLGSGQAVTGATRFGIGSATKAFTALSVGQLVDRGLLRWDDKVREHLPWMEHYDPSIREEMKVYDLLCARYGIGVQTDSQPLFFSSRDASARDLVNRAQHLKPDFGFRECFAYSNFMYIAAGELVAEVSQSPWQEFVRRSIFEPAGMRTASFEADGEGAAPHARVGGLVQSIGREASSRAISPTGGIVACAQDMAQWLKLQLNEGLVDGRQVASAAVLRRSHRLHSILSDPDRDAPQLPFKEPLASNYWGYGLGWFLSEYQGEPMVWHSGGTAGFRSGVVLFPNRRFGVVVLANRQPTNLNFALALHAYDLRFGRKGPDWSQLLLQGATSAAGSTPFPPAPSGAPAPSSPLSAYAGVYRDAGAFEAAQIAMTPAGELTIRLGRVDGALRPWRGDMFAVDWNAQGWIGRQFLDFQVDQAGAVKAFTLGRYGPFERR